MSNKAKSNLLATFESMLKSGSTGTEIVKTHTARVDTFLKTLLPDNDKNHPFAVFATGGYGRKELAPFSDIDIMFFSPDRSNSGFIEEMYYKCLDSGLPISHSFRIPEECLEESEKDVRTKTSLLDTRFICGDSKLTAIFKEKVFKEIIANNRRDFFTKRLNETKERHAKYGRSLYLLEPNVKECKGALRDIHEAMWLSRISLNLSGFDQLSEILTPDDFKQLSKAFDFLLRVRIALHLICKRGNDNLSFEYQEETAKMLGIRSSKKFQSTERLLRFYYLRVKKIRDITARIKKVAISSFIKVPSSRRKMRINDHYSLSLNKIMANSSDPFKRAPEKIPEAYLLHAKTGKSFSNRLSHTIKTSLTLINKRTRDSETAARFFIEILKSDRVYTSVRMMHDDGVLDRFFPEFGSVRFLVVHEPFHCYTVDEHTLFAIKSLEDLKLKNLSQSSASDRAAMIFHNYKDKENLYLALLFHDIGKAKGSHHTAEGYKSLKYILDRLKLKKESRDLVEFLVKNHILMSRIAFHRDIEDPEVISDFTEHVKNEKLLNALFLITYADMSAVNPEFLSEWKKNLLYELHDRALNHLRGVTEDVDKYTDQFINSINNTFIPEKGLNIHLSSNIEEIKSAIVDFLKAMPRRYLLSSTPEKISMEYTVIENFRKNNYSLHLERKNNGIAELTVAARDRSGLLADILGVLSNRRLNIVSLKTFSASEGFVLDRIEISNWDKLWWEGMYELLETEIERVVTKQEESAVGTTERVTGKKVCRGSNNHIPVTSFIETDNEISPGGTIFETLSPDRLGLLYDITSVFALNGIDILSARINTESDVAYDSFYVSKKSESLSWEDIYNVTIQLWEALN